MSKHQGHEKRGLVARSCRVGNAWHQGFGQLMLDAAPPSFALRSEVELYLKPCRVDLELRRKPGMQAHDREARVLRGLWPRLGAVSLLEFKSPTRGFRRGDLSRLWAYGCHYVTQHRNELNSMTDLNLVLVVPSENKALTEDIAWLGCELHWLAPGYASLVGLRYTTYVVVTNQVAEQECDDYLKLFSHLPVYDPHALEWLQDWLALQERTMPLVTRNASFQEVRDKILRSMTLEERLRGLSPRDVLAQFSPEEVLAQFSPEEIRAYLESQSRRN